MAFIIMLIIVLHVMFATLQITQSNSWLAGDFSRVYANSATTQRVPVLMYHALRYYDEKTEEQRNNPYIVSVEDFYRQMRYLYTNNFHTLTPDELLGFLYYGVELPARSIFIQFDDGFACNIKRGYPILKQFGQRATIFSITSHAIVPQEPFTPEILNTFITKEEMDSVRDVFTFASHTHNLHRWSGDYTLFIVASMAEIIDDLHRSFEVVDNRTAFAFPSGLYNQYSIEALQKAGIRMAFIGEVGYVTRDCDPFRLKRFGVYNFTPFSYFREYVHVGTRNFTVYAPSITDLYTRPNLPNVWYLRNPSYETRSYVIRANRLGLTADVLVGQYRRNITRAEFTTLVARLFERFASETGELARTMEKQFFDTNNAYVEKMGGLGIATGVYHTSFEPHRWITIDESIEMLSRLAETLELIIPEDVLEFLDDAKTYLNNITRQDSAVVFVKLHDSFEKQQLAKQNTTVHTIQHKLTVISLEHKISFTIPMFMLFIFALIKGVKLWSFIFGFLAVISFGILLRTLAHLDMQGQLTLANGGSYVWLGVLIGAVLVLIFAGLCKLFKSESKN